MEDLLSFAGHTEEEYERLVEDGCVFETETRFDWRDKKDWLDTLRVEGPTLKLNFIPATQLESSHIEAVRFTKRFTDCLQQLRLAQLPDEMIEDLFSAAISQTQQMSAFSKFKERLQGEKFEAAVLWVTTYKDRLQSVKEIMQGHMPPTPSGAYEWQEVWGEAFTELADLMREQMMAVECELAAEYDIVLRSGRTQLESYLLLVAFEFIKNQIKQRHIRISNIGVLVAYAHASLLVPCAGVDPIEAMKNRLSRAKRSPMHDRVLKLLLAQLQKHKEGENCSVR